MKHSELLMLIDALLDGDISDVDFLRLEAELTVDHEARREYYERIGLTVQLEAASGMETEWIRKSENVAVHSAKSALNYVLSFVTVALILVVVGGWWIVAHWNEPKTNADSRMASSAPVEQSATGFGVVVRQKDVQWRNRSGLAEGALVPLGPLGLASGVLHIDLFSGVSLVVEGEAEFEILSSMEVSVTRGRVRATVPEPAQGFCIHTIKGKVIDLGTDFAVQVGPTRSEVHVLEGEIEWHPSGSATQRMAVGEALLYTENGQVDRVQADAASFVSLDQLWSQIVSDREGKRQSWKQFSKTMQRDPRLVAFYQMGAVDTWRRRLPNLSENNSKKASEGAIVAADRVSDRWGNRDGAVHFSPTGSRIRLTVPGEYQSLTLLCWVKINSLDRWYNSLFLTDGHDLHEPHWQIMDDGRLFFSVKKRDNWDATKGEKDKHVYYSPSFWDASLSGQWLMIATVYDVDSLMVTHYLNGDRLSEEAIPLEYLVKQVRIGNASLGNWGLPERNDPRFAVRNFNGSMDEFALFSAALSSKEIKELYEYGKP